MRPRSFPSCLERFQGVYFPGSDLLATSKLALLIPQLAANLSKWHHSDLVRSERVFALLGKQVFGYMLEMRLLSCCPQLSVVT